MARDVDDDEAGGGAGGRRRLAELGPGWISAIAGLIAAGVAVVGLWVASSGGGSSDPPPAGAAPAAQTAGASSEALAPALVAPAVGTCEQQLEYNVNGTVGPLTCPDGRLNTLAWDHYAQTDPYVMALGPDASPVDVGRAMCSDLDRTPTTISVEEDAYNAAAIYYGWEFSFDPTDAFPENC